MNKISTSELSKQARPFNLRLARAVDTPADQREPTADNHRASFRTLLEHGAEFVGDFVRYAGSGAVVAGCLVALGAVLEGVGLFLLIPLLAIVLDTTKKSGWLSMAASYLFGIAGTQTRFSQLALLLSLFTALVVFRALVNATRDIAQTELQTGFVQDIRIRIAKGLLTARWDYVARLRHSRITHVVSNGVQNIGGAASFLLQCIVSLTLIVSQCVLALMVSPLLAGVAFLLLASGGVALGLVMRRARSHGLYLTDSNLTLLNSTAQFLGGMKLAVSQNLQSKFVAEFERSLQEQTGRQVSYARQRSKGTVAATSISALAAALIVLIGLGVMNVAASQLIAMLYLFTRMIGPAQQIQHGGQLFAAGLPDYEKIKELQKELSAAAARIAVPDCAAEISDFTIVFRDVTFFHTSDAGSRTPLLLSADLTIAPGTIVGLFGPSGEGKTTFVDLLVGLFSPQSGEIVIGDTVLHGAMLDAWRDCVSYVAQDSFLFHDTIRHNLLWAAPKASEEELWNALGLVGADGFVRKLARGLDTVVGERGTLVSGGERQRLAFARAVLRKPQLLILDEATNALDLKSEGEIIRRLAGLSPRPTIIMIAHRSESVGLCERIVKLEAGRFVEVKP